MIKKLALVITVVLIISAGCSQLYDMWPARHPADTTSYLGKDPNETGKPWPTVGELKDMKEEAITKHILAQMDLKHEMEKDEAMYSRAIESATMNITSAERERQEMVGTLSNPGWLMGALIGVTGLGAYMTGARKQRPEDWTEAEHQEAVDKAVAKAKAEGGVS